MCTLMTTSLYTSAQVREVLDQGAQLVEVLPKEEYEESHLPNAIGIPLRKLDDEAPRRLDLRRKVVVYCWDNACDLSPRAAARLERMGFEQVYDYVGGKADWLAHGLAAEGTQAGDPTAGSVARRDVETCGLDDPVSGITTPYCVVVDADGVVHGVVRRSDLGEGDGRRAEEAMKKGPSTFRPNVPIAEMAEFMSEHDLASSPVTTSGGVLIGVIEREDAVRAAREQDAQR